MKLFHFYRIEDHSGVSGTGPVVEGVEFTNGWCALRWITKNSSVCFYQSLQEVKAIHGHGGKTEIVIHDFDPLTKRKLPQSSQRFEILMQIIEAASRITVLAEDPEQAKSHLVSTIQQLKDLVISLEATVSDSHLPKSAA
jgi:hypothetical protein